MTSSAIEIHPIGTEADHEAAVARIAELIGAQPGTAEGDELDILATLVDAYEAQHHAIDAPDPITAIQFRMDQQGLTRRDLEPFIGSRSVRKIDLQISASRQTPDQRKTAPAKPIP